MKNRESIIDLAVKTFNKHKHLKENAYSIEDSLVHSLEEHDTEDMSHFEYNELLKEVYETV